MRGVGTGAGAPPSAAPLPFAAAPPPVMAAGAPAAWPALSQEEAGRYAAAFRRWDADGDDLFTGAEAMPYFAQSGVATTAWFKDIWQVSDVDGDGALNGPEFIVASYFLDKAARGRCAAALTDARRGVHLTRGCAGHHPLASRRASSPPRRCCRRCSQ